MVMLLTHRQWVIVSLLSLVAGTGGIAFMHLSPWIPAGFMLAGLATGHLIISSRTCLPLPQAAILISIIYYIIAPITSIYFPATNPLYKITDPSNYFEYAIPCVWAAAIGWSFAFYRAKPIHLNEVLTMHDRSLLTGLDALIFFGLCIGFAASAVKLAGSLGTIAMLASNMRYIGVFGWLIMGRRGWKWRLFFVMFIDLYESVSTGFFLNFLLWTINVCVVIMFRHRLTTTRIVTGLVIAVLLLPCLQFAKWELRKAAWGVALDRQQLTVFGSTYTMNQFNKPLLLIGKVVESGFILVTGNQNNEFIADTAVRYNQGWIVERVQRHVPAREEFADGETVYGAITAALLPRFLMPDKMTSGGGETFTRFSGIRLNSTTSMNLGYVGEMYANFGYNGGIVACGIYGLFFGVVFQRLIAMAQRNVMLVSFIPYILNFAVVSEVGLVDVLNYTVKSLVVAVAIYAGVPAVFARINRQRIQEPQQPLRQLR